MSSESNAAIPANAGLKPDLCLAVGVTGHRLVRMPDADLEALRTTVVDLLSRIRNASDQVAKQHASHFASTTPNLRLVTALADGADTIAAEAALSAGWRLDACLPFPRDEYATDFAEGEHRQRYEQLLARASATFALTGSRTDAEAAYEAVGHVVLDQADILLALWDGNIGRGRGGTARVVAEAISRDIPVIHIDAHGNNAPVLLWSGLADFEIEQPTIDNVPRADAAATLAPVVSTLCVPPENPIDQRMLSRFYRERTRSRTPALPYPLLLAMTGTRKLGWQDVRPPSAESCAAPMAEQLAQVAHGGNYGEALANKLIARFGVADAAATYFAQVFRSGFVANFGLATIAVLLALSGPLVPAYKLPLILTELAVIFMIFINTRAGTRAGWHECWMDDRHLAEQLRSLAMASALGNLNLRESAAGDAGTLPGWVHWLSRATARELGMPHATADRDYLARVHAAATHLIEDQLAYHRANAKRMHKLEHRLHHAGEFLFGGTIVACTVWIIAKLSGAPMSFGGTIGLTEIVTALTAAMPALGAAIYGIRMQGDFAGVADRSEVTVARLERLGRALKDDPLDYSRLIARLRRLADIMLADVEHWRTTYQARPLTLPG
jgi:hypothetical protein